MVLQRLMDAELKKELSTVWPSLSQKTLDLLVTPHKRKYLLQVLPHGPLDNHFIQKIGSHCKAMHIIVPVYNSSR